MQANSTETEVHYRSLAFLGFPLYRVGDDGSVWTKIKCGGNRNRGCGAVADKWRQLKATLPGRKSKRMYIGVGVTNGVRREEYAVHCLVLTAFVGPCPKGMRECRHLNGKHKDNRLENLCWGTSKENKDDLRKHGGLPLGEQRWNAKLTREAVLEIREFWERSSKTRKDLDVMAAKFGVSFSTVKDAVKRNTWAWL